MKIELKIKCFNPGCDVNLNVEVSDVSLATALSLMSNEVIKLMNNRELKSNNETLTIGTSDGSLTSEIKF